LFLYATKDIVPSDPFVTEEAVAGIGCKSGVGCLVLIVMVDIVAEFGCG
jgi:hypothetical protein